TAYGLPHAMGYLPTKAGEVHPQPLGVLGLMDAARELGLAGVELPLPKPEVMLLEAFREALAAHGLLVVVDAPGLLSINAEAFRETLRGAAQVGARVVRATLSSLLCGDRRPLAEGWPAHLQAIAGRLREVLPCAEELGLCVALENHQD